VRQTKKAGTKNGRLQQMSQSSESNFAKIKLSNGTKLVGIV